VQRAGRRPHPGGCCGLQLRDGTRCSSRGCRLQVVAAAGGGCVLLCGGQGRGGPLCRASRPLSLRGTNQLQQGAQSTSIQVSATVHCWKHVQSPVVGAAPPLWSTWQCSSAPHCSPLGLIPRHDHLLMLATPCLTCRSSGPPVQLEPILGLPASISWPHAPGLSASLCKTLQLPPLVRRPCPPHATPALTCCPPAPLLLPPSRPARLLWDSTWDTTLVMRCSSASFREPPPSSAPGLRRPARGDVAALAPAVCGVVWCGVGLCAFM
jgi:hypothetical protein